MKGPFLIAAALLVGCRTPVRGNGVPGDETRAVADLAGVDASDTIDVDVAPGIADELAVTCDENLLTYLETRVVGDVLEVTWQRGVMGLPRTDCFVEVHRLDLETLEVSGSAAIRAEGTLPALRRAEVSGSGEADLARVPAATALVEVSGSGDVAVSASESVTVRISGSGDVRFR